MKAPYDKIGPKYRLKNLKRSPVLKLCPSQCNRITPSHDNIIVYGWPDELAGFSKLVRAESGFHLKPFDTRHMVDLPAFAPFHTRHMAYLPDGAPVPTTP